MIFMTLYLNLTVHTLHLTLKNAKNDASHQACKTLVLTQVAVMRT